MSTVQISGQLERLKMDQKRSLCDYFHHNSAQRFPKKAMSSLFMNSFLQMCLSSKKYFGYVGTHY